METPIVAVGIGLATPGSQPTFSSTTIVLLPLYSFWRIVVVVVANHQMATLAGNDSRRSLFRRRAGTHDPTQTSSKADLCHLADGLCLECRLVLVLSKATVSVGCFGHDLNQPTNKHQALIQTRIDLPTNRAIGRHNND